MLLKLHKRWIHHAQLLKDTRLHRDIPVDHIDDGAESTFQPGQPKYLSDSEVM